MLWIVLAVSKNLKGYPQQTVQSYNYLYDDYGKAMEAARGWAKSVPSYRIMVGEVTEQVVYVPPAEITGTWNIEKV